MQCGAGAREVQEQLMLLCGACPGVAHEPKHCICSSTCPSRGPDYRAEPMGSGRRSRRHSGVLPFLILCKALAQMSGRRRWSHGPLNRATDVEHEPAQMRHNHHRTIAVAAWFHLCAHTREEKAATVILQGEDLGGMLTRCVR
jgi:hypothetical protein